MGNVTTIGLDIAKNVFQVHGIDAEGDAVVRQRLTRGRMLKFFAKLPPCLIGIEACASSHYWARELVALGHEVKLMPAQYVKPYVKRGKNDAADAAHTHTAESQEVQPTQKERGRSEAMEGRLHVCVRGSPRMCERKRIDSLLRSVSNFPCYALGGSTLEVW